MEFEVEFGNLTTTTGKKPASGPLYASVDGRVADLTAGECLFIDRQSTERHVMTHDVLRAMDLTRRFATMEEHADAIENEIPSLKGRRNDIQRVMDYLVERGLLVSAEDLLKAASDAQRDVQPVKTCLCVRTCDRPEALQRILESFVAAGIDLPVLVIDDSREDENIARNKELAAENITVLDRQWRRRFVDFLAEKTGLPTESIMDAVGPTDGYAPGATWNVATLMTAGNKVVFIDDDWVYEPRQLKGASARLALTLERAESMHLSVESDWLEQLTEPSSAPWLEFVLDALGDSAYALAKGDNVDQLRPADLRGKTWGAVYDLIVDAPVKTVSAGCYGDATADTNLWFYILSPQRAGQLQTCDEKAYQRFLARPRYVRGYDQPRLLDMSPFTPVAFDNTMLLPPTASHGRGEDLLFGALVRYLYPRSVNLQAPVLLRHERDEPHPMTYPSAFVPWASRFFAETAVEAAARCQAADPEARLQQIAYRFLDVAEASPARRCEMLDEFVCYMQSQVIAQLQGAVQQIESASKHFVADAKSWLEENGKAIVKGHATPLRGWPEDLDLDDSADQLASDARDLAHTMSWWPKAWNVCADNHEQLAAL